MDMDIDTDTYTLDRDADTLLSQSQVAEVLGVSKRRVQQIELQAMHKIREAAIADPHLREWVLEKVWVPEFRQQQRRAKVGHADAVPPPSG